MTDSWIVNTVYTYDKKEIFWEYLYHLSCSKHITYLFSSFAYPILSLNNPQKLKPCKKSILIFNLCPNTFFTNILCFILKSFVLTNMSSDNLKNLQVDACNTLWIHGITQFLSSLYLYLLSHLPIHNLQLHPSQIFIWPFYAVVFILDIPQCYHTFIPS